MPATVKSALIDPEKVADFLEAAYDLTADDETWLGGVMNAARAMCDGAAASHGAIYDASDVAALRAETLALGGLPEAAAAQIRAGVGLLSPSFVARVFRSLLAEMRPLFAGMAEHGLVDAVNLNGLDPSGRGAFLVLWARRPLAVSQSERDLLRRLAHHLGAAHRVRRLLRESQPDRRAPEPIDGAEAILDADNRIVHAVGPARSQAARDDLVASAVARAGFRSSRTEAGERLRGWRPLTRARWTLVDSVGPDGARHVVARDNRSHVAGLVALSDRERQVVAYLVLGQSTKETAYALGLSDITVRVLLARSAAALGVRSRDELLALDEVRQIVVGRQAAAPAAAGLGRSRS
jgi:DNA-binding CsgD family transcriptional regulator